MKLQWNNEKTHALVCNDGAGMPYYGIAIRGDNGRWRAHSAIHPVGPIGEYDSAEQAAVKLVRKAIDEEKRRAADAARAKLAARMARRVDVGANHER